MTVHADAEADWSTIVYPVATVDLTLDPEARVLFLPWLQEGLWFRCRIGVSIQDLLCRELGIAASYLEDRIRTLFLNGQPVDDFGAARVREGDTLALSSAMPGLAGAVLRRGGYFAGLRNSITCRPPAGSEPVRPGFVRVKLFNQTLKELGPSLLAHGCYARGGRLRALLPAAAAGRWERYRPACRMADQARVLADLLQQPADPWLCWRIRFRA